MSAPYLTRKESLLFSYFSPRLAFPVLPRLIALITSVNVVFFAATVPNDLAPAPFVFWRTQLFHRAGMKETLQYPRSPKFSAPRQPVPTNTHNATYLDSHDAIFGPLPPIGWITPEFLTSTAKLFADRLDVKVSSIESASEFPGPEHSISSLPSPSLPSPVDPPPFKFCVVYTMASMVYTIVSILSGSVSRAPPAPNSRPDPFEVPGPPAGVVVSWDLADDAPHSAATGFGDVPMATTGTFQATRATEDALVALLEDNSADSLRAQIPGAHRAPEDSARETRTVLVVAPDPISSDEVPERGELDGDLAGHDVVEALTPHSVRRPRRSGIPRLAFRAVVVASASPARLIQPATPSSHVRRTTVQYKASPGKASATVGKKRGKGSPFKASAAVTTGLMTIKGENRALRAWARTSVALERSTSSAPTRALPLGRRAFGGDEEPFAPRPTKAAAGSRAVGVGRRVGKENRGGAGPAALAGAKARNHITLYTHYYPDSLLVVQVRWMHIVGGLQISAARRRMGGIHGIVYPMQLSLYNTQAERRVRSATHDLGLALGNRRGSQL
ncbi:hypothetical protein C8R46DRAFT_1196953 [Mycena filopes]|nr:hypothetical protein C8R46DRAFT_1196953 [Mycena filopes]